MSSMITGAHVIVWSPKADAVRAFLRDVLELPHVDSGGGWLLFALPPTELAVHPSEGDAHTDLFLMCDDIRATVDDLRGKGVEIQSDVTDEGYGLQAVIGLPDGNPLALYEPRHPTAFES
jgi:catechol 2,3-dioxygenase-like lactoylglutathione lyase family enzyme